MLCLPGFSVPGAQHCIFRVLEGHACRLPQGMEFVKHFRAHPGPIVDLKGASLRPYGPLTQFTLAISHCQ